MRKTLERKTEARAASGRRGAPAVDDRAPARTQSPSSAPRRASLGVDRVAVVALAPLPADATGKKVAHRGSARARVDRARASVAAASPPESSTRADGGVVTRPSGGALGRARPRSPRRGAPASEAGARGDGRASRRPRGGSPQRRRWALAARRARERGVRQGPLQDTHLEKLHHGSFPVVHVRTARE